jgi:3-isopropylmalate dehydratase large subunit
VSTISDKIIDARTVEGNDEVHRLVRVDAVLGHDATIALLADEFDARGLDIWDRDRVILTNDHFSPPSTVEHADISNRFLRFARQRKVTNLLVDRGICHQLLVEHPLCVPGALITGADSHTVMGGGLGACATGMGSTDVLFTLATGMTWLRVPPTIRVVFEGTLPEDCSGRDIVLELLRLFGESGARYRSLEFVDESTGRIHQDDRFAISNMAVELGAKFGVFSPDEVTVDYCRNRDGVVPTNLVESDVDAVYERTVRLDLSGLTPRVAKPWSPANVVALKELERVDLTVAFLGSCSSARLSDIAAAAEQVRGKRVHPHVRFIVIPASVAQYQEAMRAGHIATLLEAGAIVDHPSCGPCGGIDKGVLGAEDVCASTSNRNFRGRMGHWDSRTYLAGARAVARAAVLGYLGGEA